MLRQGHGLKDLILLQGHTTQIDLWIQCLPYHNPTWLFFFFLQKLVKWE